MSGADNDKQKETSCTIGSADSAGLRERKGVVEVGNNKTIKVDVSTISGLSTKECRIIHSLVDRPDEHIE